MGSKISTILYYALAVISAAFGALYFFKNGMMSYHFAFMQMFATDINQFNPRILELMEALKQIVGGCLIGTGVITFFITHNVLRKSFEKWANWALFLLLMIANTPLLIISYKVAHTINKDTDCVYASGGMCTPPWWLSAIAVALIIVAFIIGFVPKKESN